MAAEHTLGNAVEVYVDGKQVFRYACGFSDLESQTLLTGDEMFNIYSASKITTVTAGLQLLEQGKFLLNDPLYEYIPKFKAIDDDFEYENVKIDNKCEFIVKRIKTNILLSIY